MFVLALLAVLAGLFVGVMRRAPRLARTLAIPLAVATLTVAAASWPATIIAPVAMVAATVAVAYVLGADVRYQLSQLLPVPMNSTYRVHNPDGSTTRTRSAWVQWHGHVMRHRAATLA